MFPGVRAHTQADLTGEIRHLEHQADLALVRPRRDEMCAAERGQEVIKRDVVCEVDNGESRHDAVVLSVEEVLGTDGDIKQMPGRDTWRIMVRIRGARGWDTESDRTVVRAAATRYRSDNGCLMAAAVEADGSLLRRP